MSAEDYCELCDLPRSTCIHGNPPAPPAEKKKPEPKPRASAVRRSSTTTRATSGSSSGGSRSSAATSAPTRRVQHRWTPPDALRSHILEVLRAAGGELDADDVFLELEIRLEESFLPGDQELTPEGELRWRFAARRARQAMVSEGLMAKGRPGVWELTAAGHTHVDPLG
ncbi:hypothetical protein [Nocardioides ferulae]|uniref:hypothetical protein n=1 Tax=Nocardioides ferulae TaxID=2340821 RepID=UPI000EADD2A6|nr:hypothetical protein [Nocardioides ferulae]